MDLQIPGYKILHVLGRGGMATVYLAEQEIFEREVALKVMSRHLADDPAFGRRFLREAKIVSRLLHPHIVTVHDVGVHEGAYYLAMEYVDGPDLRQARDSLTLEEKIRVVKEIASALQFASSKGYVHRDIKPENIMLHAQDLRSVLMDFGIARAAESDLTVTQTGIAVGTPHYMSPEQARGHPVDGRTDLYSLGVVFYYLLTGAVPYHADSAVAIGIKHISDPIPRLPSQLTLLQPIVDKLMAKLPEHRFQTAGQLIEVLNKLSPSALARADQKYQQMLRRTGNHPSQRASASEATRQLPSSATQPRQAAIDASGPHDTQLHDSRYAEESGEQEAPIYTDYRDNGHYQSSGQHDYPDHDPYPPYYEEESSGYWRKAGGIAAVLATVIFGFWWLAPDHADLSRLLPGLELKQAAEQPEAEAVSPSEPEPQPQPEVKPNPQPKPEPEPVVAVLEQPKPKPAEEPAPQPVATMPEPKPAPKPKPQPVVQAQPKPEPTVAADPPQQQPATQVSEASPPRPLGRLSDGLRSIGENLQELRREVTQDERRIASAPSAEAVAAQVAGVHRLLDQAKFDEARSRYANLPDRGVPVAEREALQQRLQNAERVALLLAEGEDFLAKGRLRIPEGENALERFREVLSLDPRNVPARESLHAIESEILASARQQYLVGDWEDALASTQRVAELNPANVEAKAFLEHLEKIKRSDVATRTTVKRAYQEMQKGNLFAPKRKNAYELFQQARTQPLTAEQAGHGLNELRQVFNERIQRLIRQGEFREAQFEINRAADRVHENDRLQETLRELQARLLQQRQAAR